MNHKLFEEWLFTYLENDDLEVEQANQLQEHLQNCERCQHLVKSWREVDTQLFKAEVVPPQTGFTGRWQARFEKDRQLMQRRQTLVALLFTLGGALVILGSLILLLLPWSGMPEVFVWSWIYRQLVLVAYWGPLNNIVSILFQAFSGSISPIWWILFVGLLSELAVIWLVYYRWLTNPRRVVFDETTK